MTPEALGGTRGSGRRARRTLRSFRELHDLREMLVRLEPPVPALGDLYPMRAPAPDPEG